MEELHVPFELEGEVACASGGMETTNEEDARHFYAFLVC